MPPVLSVYHLITYIVSAVEILDQGDYILRLFMKFIVNSLFLFYTCRGWRDTGVSDEMLLLNEANSGAARNTERENAHRTQGSIAELCNGFSQSSLFGYFLLVTTPSWFVEPFSRWVISLLSYKWCTTLPQCSFKDIMGGKYSLWWLVIEDITHLHLQKSSDSGGAVLGYRNPKDVI